MQPLCPWEGGLGLRPCRRVAHPVVTGRSRGLVQGLKETRSGHLISQQGEPRSGPQDGQVPEGVQSTELGEQAARVGVLASRGPWGWRQPSGFAAGSSRVSSSPALITGVSSTPVTGLSARLLSLSLLMSALHAPSLLGEV